MAKAYSQLLKFQKASFTRHRQRVGFIHKAGRKDGAADGNLDRTETGYDDP